VDRALQHVGAHAAEGEPADKEGEDEENGLNLVSIPKSTMMARKCERSTIGRRVRRSIAT
jgi:hypothetical protein